MRTRRLTNGDPQLTLEHVSLSFPLYQGGSRSLKKQILNRSTGGQIAADAGSRVVVQALSDISIDLRAGDRVALVGANGAGKTTLLRVMAKIFEPDVGTAYSCGRISPIFDIALGIDSELSGYENIRLRGMILGLTQKEIDDKIDDIASFSNLKNHLYLPVRTYSSGMMTRLTFAVATCFSPEILLMDEWIIAGDAAFMVKANERVRKFVFNASIMVLASHSVEICKQWCNKAVWMEQGRIKELGAVEDILEKYERANLQ